MGDVVRSTGISLSVPVRGGVTQREGEYNNSNPSIFVHLSYLPPLGLGVPAERPDPRNPGTEDQISSRNSGLSSDPGNPSGVGPSGGFQGIASSIDCCTSVVPNSSARMFS